MQQRWKNCWCWWSELSIINHFIVRIDFINIIMTTAKCLKRGLLAASLHFTSLIIFVVGCRRSLTADINGCQKRWVSLSAVNVSRQKNAPDTDGRQLTALCRSLKFSNAVRLRRQCNMMLIAHLRCGCAATAARNN